jgi:hypothetical protein
MNRLPNDPSSAIETDHEIPRDPPALYVLRLKGNDRFQFRVYSSAFWGVWVHWMGDRSKPHLRDSNKCPGCLKKKKKEWKGYLHVHCYEKKQQVFLELTPVAAAQVIDQVGAGNTLRGIQMNVCRSEKDNGRLIVTVDQYSKPPEKMPAEKDPQAVLLKMWDVNQGPEAGGLEFPTTLNGFLPHPDAQSL